MNISSLRQAFSQAVDNTPDLETFSSDHISWLNSKNNKDLPILHLVYPDNSREPDRGKDKNKKTYSIDFYICNLREQKTEADLWGLFADLEELGELFLEELLGNSNILYIEGDKIKEYYPVANSNAMVGVRFTFDLVVNNC